MDRYNVTLTGISGYLPHQHNIEWLDQMKKWLADPLNKQQSVPGDDRAPAFTWLGYLYHDTKYIGISSDCIMACLREGAAKVTLSGKQTFKTSSQSGILVNEILWPLEVSNGNLVEWDSILPLFNEMDFEVHKETAKKLGFELFVKPGSIGKKKHIRVRARFDTWKVSGSICVTESKITPEILAQIFYMAGNFCGLGDWRANVSKPGQFGRFSTELVKVSTATKIGGVKIS